MNIPSARRHICALILLLYFGDKMPGIYDGLMSDLQQRIGVTQPDVKTGRLLLAEQEKKVEAIANQREIDASTRTRLDPAALDRIASRYGLARSERPASEVGPSERGVFSPRPRGVLSYTGEGADILAAVRERQSGAQFEPHTISPFRDPRALQEAEVELASYHRMDPSEFRIQRPLTSQPSGRGIPERERMASVRRYDRIVESAAKHYDVDPDLVRAMIRAESSGIPTAASPAGAVGLMQIIPDTARELGLRVDDEIDERVDPGKNIWAGTRYIAQLLKRYDGDWDKAIAAYNAGPGAVDKYGGIPPFEETRVYVPRVRGYYDSFRRNF